MPDSPSAWLRSLAAEATPGPWRRRETKNEVSVKSAANGHWVCSVSEVPSARLVYEDSRLIALAPDLAVLCADAIDALTMVDEWLDLNYGYLVDDDPSLIPVGEAVRGALARFAALQPDNTEEEQT